MIEGVIDNSPGEDALGGWAVDRKSALPLTIEARRGRTLLASTTTDSDRPDIGGHHGFVLRFGQPIDHLIDDTETAITIRAVTSDGKAQPLLWHPPLIADLRARKIGRGLIGLSPSALTQAMTTLVENGPDGLAQLRPWLSTLTTGPQPQPDPPETLSLLTLAPGTISPDGVAVIGHGGQIFLHAGSNDLAAQYAQQAGDAAVAELASQWMSLFRARADRLDALGIDYLQLVIPEKSSVLPDFWPGRIEAPTALLARLEQSLKGSGIRYVGGLAVLAGSEARTRLFRKIGTHLNYDGARLLFEALCRAMNIPPPFTGDDERQRHFWDGDFQDNFPALPLLEPIEVIDGPALRAASKSLKLVQSGYPLSGHIGTHLVWENPTAPIDLSVLAFGNSFFERGGGGDCLSWWCARAFRRFEFVWTPDFDFDLVVRSRPQVVIGQTIERFLPRVAVR